MILEIFTLAVPGVLDALLRIDILRTTSDDADERPWSVIYTRRVKYTSNSKMIVFQVYNMFRIDTKLNPVTLIGEDT